MKKRNYFLLTLFIVLGLLLTACGGSDDKTSGGKSDEKEDEVQLIDPEKDFPKKSTNAMMPSKVERSHTL